MVFGGNTAWSSDSLSKNSYIGSYYQPPDGIPPRPQPALAPMNTPSVGPGRSLATHDVGSKAVIAALKTLQEKIRRVELERETAEKNVQLFSRFEHTASSSTGHTRTPHTVPAWTTHTVPAWTTHTVPARTTHTVPAQKTHTVPAQNMANKRETRCQVLEKQLDQMRRMVEKAEQDKNALAEHQASLQKQKAPDSSGLQSQREKLEKLEKECVKLSQTQSQAELKMSVLEQKLIVEEHERRLVQEKADELQREMDLNLRLCSPPGEELKPKKKSARRPFTSKLSSEQLSPTCSKGKRMPFVAGTSTSPSHSVHANMQSLLHMLKHHQPQLCDRMRSLHQPTSQGGARKSLRRALSSTEPKQVLLQSLGSLSDLLLALQDELGQMSFEHQELVHLMEETPGQETREELERELEGLLGKMEDKGVQITKLRMHQHTVHLLNQNTQQQATGADPRGPKAGGASPPPRPSPVTEAARRGGGASHGNLRLLKETQRFRNSLKTDDLSWET
ncbi:hypothetical protein NHX12_026546 [Muraenolepis orangiensis]|uniref:Centrosomal protein 57kDa-like protein 1 n=1 Tax=Muraenolepis orangiensis TaxID=630683 RepID=A0A9Q0IRZ4_9TELE|nr:hypothetical protein NHX12_026546 [Muraenolepis orangiensis]